MILVIGATGTVGSEVTRQLIAAGQKPRVLVRSADKVKDLAGKVEVAVGDLDNAKSVNDALKGVDKAFLLTSGTEGIRREEQFIDAAKAAGVKHVVKLSVIGAEYEAVAFGKWHRKSEKKLEASGMSWTFLRPGNFMTNTLGWAGSIKGQNAIYAPQGEGKTADIDPADIAAVAVKVLTTPGHEGKAYTLTGPALLTVGDKAAILSKVSGRTIKYVDVTPEAAKDGMLKGGMPEAYVEALLELLAVIKKGGAAVATGVVQELIGRKPNSFENWAQAHAAAFK
jgi:uncharacterized protein YbjT (DUF2867 family)